MLKQSFSDALKGIFIGLILSIFFSYLFSPELYLPLSPNSAVGHLDVLASCSRLTGHALLCPRLGCDWGPL